MKIFLRKISLLLAILILTESFGINFVRHCGALHVDIVLLNSMDDSHFHHHQCAKNEPCEDHQDNVLENVSYAHSHAKCCISNYYRLSPAKRLVEKSQTSVAQIFSRLIAVFLLPEQKENVPLANVQKVTLRSRDILLRSAILII